MIASVLLAVARVASPPSEADIVVIGRKMRMIGVDMTIRKRGGRPILRACRINRPSGYAEREAMR